MAYAKTTPQEIEGDSVRSALHHTYEEPPPAYSLDVLPASEANPSIVTPGTGQHLSPAEPLMASHQHSNMTSSSNTLNKPIAIPATDKKLGSPFLRSYPSCLENFALPREVFLRFLDDLNRIAVASPPLQVLGLAGSIVGIVPLQTAQIVGGALNAAATVGTVAVSKGRTELFIRQANKDTFGPRGLQVSIAKIDALSRIAGMPFVDQNGKLNKGAAILAPIDDLTATQNTTAQERRLQALEPWVAHLDLEPLPGIEIPTNPLSRLSVAASERQRKKGEQKMLKDRHKAVEDYHKESAKAEKDREKELAKLEKDTRKAYKEDDPRKVEKELAKIDKERAKIMKEYEKEVGKIEKDRKKDDKEEEGMRKILWLVIRNLDVNTSDEGDVLEGEGGV